MRFGKDKRYIRKTHNVLKIPVGLDGIGEEKHPTIIADIPQHQRDPIEEKVLSIVNGTYIEPEVTEKKPGKISIQKPSIQ